MKDFVSYTISYKDMLKSWINDICPEDHILIIYDPLSNYDYLRSKSVTLDELHLYESKLLVMHFINIDDALEVMNSIDFLKGPLCEFWSRGRFITDNSVSCNFK